MKYIESGCKFIATNEDATLPCPVGELPGAGVMVAAVRTCTGQTPHVIGKPNAEMLFSIIKENSLNADEICVVGDRLETDILVGINAKLKTLLVETGVHKQSDCTAIVPDFVARSIGDLLLHAQ
jgi:ribonucleotide monophosphatase NagD (HAD superfamily)